MRNTIRGRRLVSFLSSSSSRVAHSNIKTCELPILGWKLMHVVEVLAKKKGAVQTYLRDLLVGYVPAIGATMDFCVWV